ncbi:MAG TPA: division/cell wall cluster transcriptional repressor MraZ [Burkholderiales bacterium]|nr:division/cell wall cluster transcriptional repressor MraZ [Burkholderiales bacterium]
MFQGATALTLDAKGRLAVPTRHREGLVTGSNGKLVLTAHPHRCLLLYPAAAWEPIRARIMTFSSFDQQASNWKRVLVGFAEDQGMDASGRLLVSAVLRKYAGIDKQVMFVGQGSHFELWSQESWDRQIEQVVTDPERLPPGMENFAL